MATKEAPVGRVLVVDDELLIRWSLAQTLQDHGFEVVQAESARAALRAVQSSEQPFDFALLDLRLADSDDLSLLTMIRTLSPQTRVVLMSAFTTPEVHRDALALGAIHVISKPFDIHDIPALLTRPS